MIPELVYRPIYDRTGRAIVAAGDNSRRGKVWKAQQGWRERLLCYDCEQFLNQHYEQPSAAIWKTLCGQERHPEIQIERAPDGTGKVGILFRGVDYPTLKLFFMSILWRAGVASTEQFASVQLGGKHERELRHRLLERDPGQESDYACFVLLGVGGWKEWRVVGPPFRYRLREHWCYRFILTRVVLTILVSSHFWQEGSQPLALSPRGTLAAGPVELSELSELREMGQLVRSVPAEEMQRYGLE